MGPVFGGIRVCCTLCLKYSSTPRGYYKGYSSTPRVPLGGNPKTHGLEFEIATVRFGLRDLVAYSSDAIRSSNLSTPSSTRSANAHFQRPQLIWSAGGRDAASANGDVCAPRY